MNTGRLIETLVQDLRPVAPLSRPWIRSAWWLLGASAYLGVLTLMMASPAEVAANGQWPSFFHHVAAIVTAATAASAAFASTVPGSSRLFLLLPPLAAIVWLASLAGGAVQEWNQGGVNLAAPAEWVCVAMIVFGGAVPGLGMAIMLRRGALLTPALTAGMGMLAVGSLASISACLSHPHLSDSITLVWHGATILTLVAMAGAGSRAVLTWKTQ